MRRQILLGIVQIGNTAISHTSLTEDQRAGLLGDKFAAFVQGHKNLIMLTDKGKKVYAALEAVVAIGTNW